MGTNRQQKLDKWAKQELTRNLTKIIIDNPDGSILAYGRYKIQQISTGLCEITDFHDAKIWFGSKKTALSWCVATRYQDFNLARHIQQLDAQKTQIGQDINLRHRSAESSGTDRFRELVMTKLESKRCFYDSVVLQLEKCVNRAKYLQYQGLQHETARTRGI